MENCCDSFTPESDGCSESRMSSWYPELEEVPRYAILCSVVPNCFPLDEVIAYFLTDT